MPAGLRKRDVRALCRAGSYLAVGLLALNVITFHAMDGLAYYAGALMVVIAMANLYAAFADDGAMRNFGACACDLASGVGCAAAYILAQGGEEMPSRALSMGMHLLAMILEVIVIAFTMAVNLAGIATEIP